MTTIGEGEADVRQKTSMSSVDTFGSKVAFASALEFCPNGGRPHGWTITPTPLVIVVIEMCVR